MTFNFRSKTIAFNELHRYDTPLLVERQLKWTSPRNRPKLLFGNLVCLHSENDFLNRFNSSKKSLIINIIIARELVLIKRQTSICLNNSKLFIHLFFKWIMTGFILIFNFIHVMDGNLSNIRQSYLNKITDSFQMQ